MVCPVLSDAGLRFDYCSAVKSLSVLLVALSAIFLINFAIISLLTGVEPHVRCYHQYSESGYHQTYSKPGVNFWEGLWIPIPSCVTGIIGKNCSLSPLIIFWLIPSPHPVADIISVLICCRPDYCLRSQPVQEGGSLDHLHPHHPLQPRCLFSSCDIHRSPPRWKVSI